MIRAYQQSKILFLKTVFRASQVYPLSGTVASSTMSKLSASLYFDLIWILLFKTLNANKKHYHIHKLA